MDSLFPNCHILLLETPPEPRIIALTAAVYRIGRSGNNDIVVTESDISRQHAILIRIPISEKEYTYQLIDGDRKGNRSRNGIRVNRKRYSEITLNHTDKILFGGTVKAHYYMRQDISDFKQKHNLSLNTLSSQEPNPLDMKQTLICTDIRNEINAFP